MLSFFPQKTRDGEQKSSEKNQFLLYLTSWDFCRVSIRNKFRVLFFLSFFFIFLRVTSAVCRCFDDEFLHIRLTDVRAIFLPVSAILKAMISEGKSRERRKKLSRISTESELFGCEWAQFRTDRINSENDTGGSGRKTCSLSQARTEKLSRAQQQKIFQPRLAVLVGSTRMWCGKSENIH